MNKTILALVMSGAYAGAASAETAPAAPSSVTIYGIADLALDFQGGGPNGASSAVKMANPYGSRIGLRGNEDLGGGNSALFVLESGITVNTGALSQGGLMFGRQAYGGLKSDTYGTLTMGRQYSSRFLAIAQIADPFQVGFSGQAHNILDGDAVRVNNSVKYATPVVNGVSADVMYAPGGVAGSSASGSQLGGSVGYTRDKLNVRLAYQGRNGTTLPIATTRNTMLAGTYDFGVAKLHMAYSVNRGPLAKGSTDNNDMLIGATIPFGRVHTIRTSYVRKKDRTALQQDASQIAVGYFYALSKSTDLYTVYSHIRNTNGAIFTVNNGSDTGIGNRGTEIGMRHFF
ncbi:MAG TPA: porin [Janthinobacterium sp.]|nr:porin [Janthinobacterium sp.]